MVTRRHVMTAGLALLFTSRARALGGTPTSRFMAPLNDWIDARNGAKRGTVDQQEREQWKAVRRAWRPFRGWVDKFYGTR